MDHDAVFYFLLPYLPCSTRKLLVKSPHTNPNPLLNDIELEQVKTMKVRYKNETQRGWRHGWKFAEKRYLIEFLLSKRKMTKIPMRSVYHERSIINWAETFGIDYYETKGNPDQVFWRKKCPYHCPCCYKEGDCNYCHLLWVNKRGSFYKRGRQVQKIEQKYMFLIKPI